MTFVRLATSRVIVFAAAALATSLCGVAVAAPRSATPVGGYRGRTTQGIAVQLGPQRAAGRAFRYRARMRCSDGSTFLDSYFTDDVQVRHGSFSSHVSSSGGAVRTSVTGKVGKTRARGTIRIIERYSEIPDAQGDTPLDPNGAIVCDSHVVRWSATAIG